MLLRQTSYRQTAVLGPLANVFLAYKLPTLFVSIT